MRLTDLPRVRAERRIVVLISDGLDNRSRTSADSVIKVALEKQVSFYVIHLPLFEPRDGRLAVRRPTKGFKDSRRRPEENISRWRRKISAPAKGERSDANLPGD